MQQMTVCWAGCQRAKNRAHCTCILTSCGVMQEQSEISNSQYAIILRCV